MDSNNDTSTLDNPTVTDDAMTTLSHNLTFTTQSNINVNTTRSDGGIYVNRTVTEGITPWLNQSDGYGLGTMVTVAIALGSAAVIIIIVIVVVCLIRKRIKKKKSRAWVDNLTLSYIADSNIDLTKDNYDEMVSLDNDNFLNSLVDAQAFSVYSSSHNTRQYTYSYF